MGTQTTTGAPTDGHRAGHDVRTVLRAQRRRRRSRFWLGFAVIALVGGPWAGLTRDPVRPGLFDQGGVAEVEAVDVEVPAPTVAFEPVPTTTEAPSTTAPPTTAPPTPSTTGTP